MLVFRLMCEQSEKNVPLAPHVLERPGSDFCSTKISGIERLTAVAPHLTVSFEPSSFYTQRLLDSRTVHVPRRARPVPFFERLSGAEKDAKHPLPYGPPRDHASLALRKKRCQLHAGERRAHGSDAQTRCECMQKNEGENAQGSVLASTRLAREKASRTHSREKGHKRV